MSIKKKKKGKAEIEQLCLVPYTHISHDTTGYVSPMKTWLWMQDTSGSVEFSLLLEHCLRSWQNFWAKN